MKPRLNICPSKPSTLLLILVGFLLLLVFRNLGYQEVSTWTKVSDVGNKIKKHFDHIISHLVFQTNLFLLLLGE